MGCLTVLVASGEAAVRQPICSVLAGAGYDILECADGEAALTRLFTQGADLLIADLELPPQGGLYLLWRVRLHSSVPFMLLGPPHDGALIQALDRGADDYVPLPCRPAALLSRVRAVLRRLRPRSAERRQVVVVGDVTVDLDQRRLFVRDREVVLSPTEWQLLAELAANAGRLLPHEELLTRAWGPEYRRDRQYLRVWIRRLRRKLDDDGDEPRYIHTVPGVGYMFAPPQLAAVPSSR
ncbi:MAG TPA: response regulator transcription factor [Chloroflexota bacterium]|jgi:two-component system KDP operon response regulator KdpE|nr:response regulator transcription factor [Chloroflexota bacterium]